MVLTDQRLDAGEDGGHVVGGAPPVLQDVEADAAVSVDVGVEHLRRELHHRRLVRVLLAELQRQLEGAVLEHNDGLSKVRSLHACKRNRV